MCTLEKHGNIFFLTLTGYDEHRLDPTLIATIRTVLSKAKSQSTRGTALVTVAEGKFFSNGLDLALAKSPSEASYFVRDMVELFKDVVADLITMPMPTIAAVTGHATGAGMMLAMCHDYVMMVRGPAVLYMSEVDIGLSIPRYAAAVMRSKVGKPEVWRDVLLRGVKVKADEGVAKGLVDSAHDSIEKTVEAAVRMGEELVKGRWDGEVYAERRMSLYPELVGALGLATKSYVKARL